MTTVTEVRDISHLGPAKFVWSVIFRNDAGPHSVKVWSDDKVNFDHAKPSTYPDDLSADEERWDDFLSDDERAIIYAACK